MPLKIEVEEIKFQPGGGYTAVVRANRYNSKNKSINPPQGKPVQWTVQEKSETVAEFAVQVSSIAFRRRKTERPIEDIIQDARGAVQRLCREIVEQSRTKNQGQSPAVATQLVMWVRLGLNGAHLPWPPAELRLTRPQYYERLLRENKEFGSYVSPGLTLLAGTRLTLAKPGPQKPRAAP